jgi:hypothetical protein
MPDYTFTCSDENCGTTKVLLLPIKACARKRRCPGCGRRTFERNLSADLLSIAYDDAGSNYKFRFPYVSNSFPFGARGAAHHGSMKKCIIENRQHEDRMRKLHGFVGEKDIKHEQGPSGRIKPGSTGNFTFAPVEQIGH